MKVIDFLAMLRLYSFKINIIIVHTINLQNNQDVNTLLKSIIMVISDIIFLIYFLYRVIIG